MLAFLEPVLNFLVLTVKIQVETEASFPLEYSVAQPQPDKPKSKESLWKSLYIQHFSSKNSPEFLISKTDKSLNQ